MSLQVVEPVFQSDDGHLHQVRDAASANLHIVSLRLQTGAVTFRTGRLTTIAAQHHPVLDLILVLLHHLEESIDADLVVNVLMTFGGESMPQHVLLLLRQVVVRFEDREVILRGTPAELLFPHAHLLTMPAYHTAVVYRQGAVGNHQMLVDTDDLAKALALRTGTHGGVEGEKVVGRLLELHAIRLEAHGEIIGDHRGQEHQPALSVALIESRLGRVDESGDGILRVIDRQAVNDEVVIIRSTRITRITLITLITQKIINTLEVTIDEDACITVEHIHLQLLLQGATLRDDDGSHDHKLSTLGILLRALDDVLGRVLLHLLSADGRIGTPDAGIEQSQILVNLCGGTYGGAGIA